MVKMAETAEKTKVKYLEDIITIEQKFENSVIDISQVPVFKIENCEVEFSSLNSKTPKTGHSVRILFPDNVFYDQDKQIRQGYLKARQVQNPDLESVKTFLKKYTEKDFLAGKITENKVGRSYIDVSVSNSVMFDKTLDENGEEKLTHIEKAEYAKGEAVVKYFRVIDKYTGKGIDPVIYKYEDGEKVTTFVNKKTKEELPLYVQTGDLVNIELRPYEFVSSKQENEVKIKYNLLSVEVVQTAWDRGIGRKSGTSKNVVEKQDSVGMEALAGIFGNIGTATSKPVEKTETKKAEKKVEEPKPEVVSFESEPKTTETVEKTTEVEQPKAEVKAEEPKAETNEVGEIDFNQLLSGLSL